MFEGMVLGGKGNAAHLADRGRTKIAYHLSRSCVHVIQKQSSSSSSSSSSMIHHHHHHQSSVISQQHHQHGHDGLTSHSHDESVVVSIEPMS
eukprot:378100-Amphidinium_carterae.1